MILNMEVRTTQQVRVVCKSLSPDEEEAPAITELLGTLNKQNPYQFDIFDHSMVIHYDPPSDAEQAQRVPDTCLQTRGRGRNEGAPVY